MGEKSRLDRYLATIHRRKTICTGCAEYFVYGEEQDCVYLRREYLQTALEINSDSGDGDIYLLNPQIITADGEWEAWHFGNKLPGAIRYRSFYEMMQQAVNQGAFVY